MMLLNLTMLPGWLNKWRIHLIVVGGAVVFSALDMPKHLRHGVWLFVNNATINLWRWLTRRWFFR
jgi:hypothetical protein